MKLDPNLFVAYFRELREASAHHGRISEISGNMLIITWSSHAA